MIWAQPPKLCYISNMEIQGGNPMYQIQMKFHKTGDWENTVFLPMEFMKALDIQAMLNQLYSHEHCYRIVEAN